MAYFPSTFPAVAPTLDDRRFWELCAARRLCFQRCGDCDSLRHPPTPLCPRCQSLNCGWSDAPSVGRIFSYTVVRHPSHAAAKPVVPYNVVLVEFDGCDGVRLVSNVVDAAPEELAVGRRVEIAWDEGTGGQLLPRFRLMPTGRGTQPS